MTELRIQHLEGGDRGIVLLGLCRPEAKNALGRQLLGELEAALAALAEAPAARVVVLHSLVPGAFCAGADLKERAGMTAEQAEAFVERLRNAFTALAALALPTVAAIEGAALGGGLELALACDILLMADDAWLQLPELKRGLLPDGGGLQRLPRRIPWHVATAMIWTGERMTAAEALRWGLVWRTAPRAGLMDLARATAARVAQGAPLALQALKEVLRVVDGMADREAMALRAETEGDLEHYRRMLGSDDMIEEQRAFLEKRAPRWSGR